MKKLRTPDIYADYMHRWEEKHNTPTFRFVFWMVAAITWCLAFGCVLVCTNGCVVVSAPTALPAWMEEEWRIAQCRVASLNPPPSGDPYSVTRNGLDIRTEPGIFQCGDILSYGCFHRGGPLIRYSVKAPKVMRHEFGHYILFRLQDPRGTTYEHESWTWPTKACE